MDIRVSIVGMNDVQRELRRISDEVGRGKATAAAINKVAAKAQVEIRRAIVERYVIKADQVRGSLALRRATSKRGSVEAVINVFGSPTNLGRSMNMIRFLAAVQAAGAAQKTRGARGTKKQLAALGKQIGFAIKRGGGLKTIPGAFVGNQGRTVFERVAGKQMRSRSGNLTKHSQAIRAVQVIGVSQMFSERGIRARVMAKIGDDLAVEMKRAVDMILAKRA